jgi:2-methylcitrate dehydratase PrpD
MFERGWHYTTLHGNFSATAVAGKLLGLEVNKMINAYGLAYHQAGGNLQGLIDGTLAKRLGPGFSVRNGITAVQMAVVGLTGPRNSLSGKHGLFNVYHHGDYEPRTLVDRLGEKYEVLNLSYKPYPCCRENHLSIDAALQLKSEFDIKSDNIKEIIVHMSREGMVAVFSPLIDKQNPKNVVDAQFSTPWTVAWALVYGSVGIEAFTPEAIHDEKVLALSRKVHPVPDDSLAQLGVSPTVVNIITKTGETHTQKVETAYGSPGNPMSMQDMANKMIDCVANAAGQFGSADVEQLTSMCMNLEDLDDVRRITRILSAPQAWS